MIMEKLKMDENIVKLGTYLNITLPEHLKGNEKDRFIIDQIMKDSEARVSENEISERAIGMLEQFDMQLSQQGLSLAEYYAKRNTDEKKLFASFRKHAERQLKERKILFCISRMEGIRADEEDFKACLERMNKLYPLSIEKLYTILNGKEKKRIMEEITLRKTLDFIADHSDNSHKIKIM